MFQVPLIPFVPATGAVINGLIGSRWFSRRVVAVVACAASAIALALSVWSLVTIFAGTTEPRVHDVVLGDWIPAIPLETAAGIEMFTVRWTLRLDPLSAVMSTLVAALGLVMHLYATASMRDEPRAGCARFFSYLNLFCAFMLMLVLSGNFLVLLVGWQGMALCSFLLMAGWFGNRDAASGAMKAFVVNWLGDWGLLVAIFLTYFTFGTLDFREVAASVTSLPAEAGTFGAVSAICLGLWIAAVAGIGQIPLPVWLPGALEGPAPVAALIQATRVTAGVFIMARNRALFERAPGVLTIATTLVLVILLISALLPVAGILIARPLNKRDPGGVSTLARALARFDRGVAGWANACGWTVQIAAWMAHMFDKHVLDRIADACVSGFRALEPKTQKPRTWF